MLAILLVHWVLPVLAHGQPVERLGTIGDSLTDEYFEQSYDYARAWTELLVEERGLTFGPTASDAGEPGGSWGEPRRTGFEDNWARSGATTDDALAAGQHSGVAEGAIERDISHILLYIGGNDFSPWAGAYDEIYDGLWNQAEIDSWIAGRVANLRFMLDTVQPTGARIVLFGILDFSVMPWLNQGDYDDPTRREAVAAAVGQFGDEIQSLAEQRALVFLDVFALGRAVFGTNLAPRTVLLVGNVEIDLTGRDTPSGGLPTAAFVDDGVHPNTVLQGVWANVAMTALNLGFDADLPLLSEAEILAAAGIPYGGSDTLENEIGPLAGFVTVYRQLFADGFESGDTAIWSSTIP